MKIYFNPLDLKCKNVIGAVCQNENLTISVQGNISTCTLILRKDGEPINVQYIKMDKFNNWFTTTLQALEPGLYFYHFDIDRNYKIGLNGDYVGEITYHPIEFQLTVYSNDYTTPSWLKGGLIYQIFPDRFCKEGNIELTDSTKWLHDNWDDLPEYLPVNGRVYNNDFFGGNFKGIESKLTYLKDLGVTTIYLNPIFEAYSNHRYDTGDYMKFDQLLGSDADFKSLINSANKLGIKIILDGVFNHTGSDSKYFNKYKKYNSIGAYQSKKSKYSDWYSFINFPDTYEAWWGIDTLPAINDKSESFIEFITGENGVLNHYLNMGIGGWRFDVIDEIPSHVVKKMRQAIKSTNKDAVMIGEVWEDATNKIAYSVRREYFQGKELDSVMNYVLKDAIINFVLTDNVSKLKYAIKEQIDHYPKCALDSLMNILDTHDTYRILSILSGINTHGMSKTDMSCIRLNDFERQEAFKKLKFASILQYTLPGVPSLYYGDEAGMEGMVDPLNRQTMPWNDIDNEFLNWYKKLGEIRSKINIFADGEYKELFSTDKVLVFQRVKGTDNVVIAVNRDSDNTYQLRFNNATMFNLITGEEFNEKLDIKPMEYGIYYHKKI